MGRKPRVDRSPEEKWQIVQEGIKSGNVSETCRRHGIAPNLFYRWKDEAEQGAKAALGGRSAAAAETEKDHRIRQLERTLGRKALEIEILKNVVGECAAVKFTPKRGSWWRRAMQQAWWLQRCSSVDRACTTGSSHAAAEQTDNTMNISWRLAERNPPTDIDAWPGGCGERKESE